MNAKQYNIGFIGLGLMGKGFTERLVKMGHSVIGYDLDFKNVKEASVYGGSCRQVSRRCCVSK